MNALHQLPEKKKMLLVGLLVLLLLGGAFIMRMVRQPENFPLQPEQQQEEATPGVRPTASADGPTALLEPEKTNVSVGEEIPVRILFLPDGNSIDGADATIKYTSGSLGVSRIENGPFFKEYPRRDIDVSRGMIKITAFRGNEGPISEPIELATIYVTVNAPGAQNLDFVFTRGSSKGTVLVQHMTSKNILENAQGAVLNAGGDAMPADSEGDVYEDEEVSQEELL